MGILCISSSPSSNRRERESKRTKRKMSIVHLFFFSFMIDINEKKKEQKRKKTFSYFGSAMNLAQAHDEPCSKIHVSILTVGFVNSHRHHFLKKCGRILHATNKLAMLFNLKPHSPSSRPPNWVWSEPSYGESSFPNTRFSLQERKNHPPQQLSFSRDCSHQQCNGGEDGFLCLFLCFRAKKTEEVFLSKKHSSKKFVAKRRNHEQAKMDNKQISVRKWDREVVCRTQLLAREAVGTREGDEEDERWRETWEEVAVSHPLDNSMAELSSPLSLALDNSWQKLSSSLSTSRFHSITLPRQFRAEFSSSVSGSRSVSSNRQLRAESSSTLSLSLARFFSLSTIPGRIVVCSLWFALTCLLLRQLRTELSCSISRSRACDYAFSSLPVGSAGLCTLPLLEESRFLFSVSLLTYLQIYAYSKFSLLWFVQEFMRFLVTCLSFSCVCQASGSIS